MLHTGKNYFYFVHYCIPSDCNNISHMLDTQKTPVEQLRQQGRPHTQPGSLTRIGRAGKCAASGCTAHSFWPRGTRHQKPTQLQLASQNHAAHSPHRKHFFKTGAESCNLTHRKTKQNGEIEYDSNEGIKKNPTHRERILTDKELKGLKETISRIHDKRESRIESLMENFSKELENILKNQLDIKNTIPEMKTTLEGIDS